MSIIALPRSMRAFDESGFSPMARLHAPRDLARRPAFMQAWATISGAADEARLMRSASRARY